MSYKDPERKREANRKWRADNPEKARYFDSKWQKDNPEKSQAYQKAYRDIHNKSDDTRRWRANYYLKTKYGMTLEEYEARLKAQNGVCKICFKKETKRHQSGQIVRLQVDHDHKTGAVRALLCNRCNMTLGKLEESVELASAMIAYLEHYGSAT